MLELNSPSNFMNTPVKVTSRLHFIHHIWLILSFYPKSESPPETEQTSVLHPSIGYPAAKVSVFYRFVPAYGQSAIYNSIEMPELTCPDSVSHDVKSAQPSSVTGFRILSWLAISGSRTSMYTPAYILVG